MRFILLVGLAACTRGTLVVDEIPPNHGDSGDGDTGVDEDSGLEDDTGDREDTGALDDTGGDDTGGDDTGDVDECGPESEIAEFRALSLGCSDGTWTATAVLSSPPIYAYMRIGNSALGLDAAVGADECLMSGDVTHEALPCDAAVVAYARLLDDDGYTCALTGDPEVVESYASLGCEVFEAP